MNSPFDVLFDCCYFGYASDTGNDRIVGFLAGDPVESTTWGRMKTRYE